ncbi:ArnT family glycosyltransferase [Nocardia transvalensis]|uniref:ArnT family glycosyltransferase n=1 Tax=Nocardia transvalensis TaxID=37333 RepID=UPI001895666E|nr:glycosyltransferase family 39 protein [Nocardia transvalensis]MBF6329128.1 glycosyltransferase family 39 protein [Nocardia transvalensis]
MTTALSGPSTSVDGPSVRVRRWEYSALAVLLCGTAIAYLCNLDANGWANSFYAAAAQAGSVSWKAFFFGSSDAGNSITVDKTPAALWPMALSIRVFGLSSWSLLFPQVLMGVGAVALLWATVRRSFGAAAGLLAGLVLAVTPVAALMFRFDNPDALLVLLMVAAAWALTRAVEDGRTRWLVLCGVFIGLGFLAKQLQVTLVVPALALTYLIAGPPRLPVRIAQLFAALVGVLVGAGWWVLIAEVWPTGSRPYFGGSPHNSILELTLGYNGLGRLNGDEFGSVGPGGELPHGGAGFWGSAGITRLFEPAQGGQIAWLLPAALALSVAGIILCGKAARTDRRRAAFVLWGGWLIVTGLVFSLMKGIFHQYYTVALSPAIAALTGAGAVLLWRHRERLWVRCAAVLTLGLTIATAWMLLSRSASFLPWLRWVVLSVGIVVAVLLLIPTPRRIAVVTALTAVVVALAGPLAYTVDTIATAHAGPLPSAGPRLPMHDMPPWAQEHARGERGPEGGRGGNFMAPSHPGEQLLALLEDNADAYTWAAATVSSMPAAGYQLATELPVMPIGGFNGSDPAPTLGQFQRYVSQGRIHYFIAGDERRHRRSDTSGVRITEWVKANFTAREVDGVTVYDLTQQR